MHGVSAALQCAGASGVHQQQLFVPRDRSPQPPWPVLGPQDADCPEHHSNRRRQRCQHMAPKGPRRHGLLRRILRGRPMGQLRLHTGSACWGRTRQQFLHTRRLHAARAPGTPHGGWLSPLWTAAQAADRLLPRESLRTETAAAACLFLGGAGILIDEDSLRLRRLHTHMCWQVLIGVYHQGACWNP